MHDSQLLTEKAGILTAEPEAGATVFSERTIWGEANLCEGKNLKKKKRNKNLENKKNNKN